MAKYKAYDYNQLVMVPVCLEDQLQPGTLEHTIHYVITERMDLSSFAAEYNNDETGRTAYDPAILLKIVLLGYARGQNTSRRLERACRENVVFMAMTCGQQPDHSTIAAFISGMKPGQVEELFAQVLLVCEEEGLLAGTQFSLDGLKLPSNASKEWSGKRSDLERKRDALKELVKKATKEHREKDRRGKEDDEAVVRRIRRLERNAERIERFLAENKPKQGRSGSEVQSNVTDNESAKMKSAHGTIQGYNANAMTDAKAQVVVHAEVFGEGDDASLAGPMIEGAERNLEAVGRGPDAMADQVLSADTGYYSVKNLTVCQEHEVDAYIPDRHFRQRDPRFAEALRHRRPMDRHKQQFASRKKYFTAEDFRFDDQTQKLICPAGAELYVRTRNFEVDGNRYIAYQAPIRACRGCALRSKCLRKPSTPARQVHILVGRRTGSLTDKMKAKIDTPEGRAIYSRRLGIVEPVFGNIRAQKRLDRFTLRGREKVNKQWKLYCMVHNIEKLRHAAGGLN
jgi:transposase